MRDGGAETIQTVDDVERLERDMNRDAEERGVQIGFDYFWVLGGVRSFEDINTDETVEGRI